MFARPPKVRGSCVVSGRYRVSTDRYRLCGRLVLGSTAGMGGEKFAEGSGSVFLHSGDDVLVGRHRERRVGMSEAFGHDLDRHPVAEQEAGVGVA